MVDRTGTTASSVDSLKELITIISGLAATNSVLQFMNGLRTSDGYSLSHADLVPSLMFVVTILMIVRFYQGNIRHLDEEYSGHSGKAYSAPSALSLSSRVATDFVVILIEALLLTGLSFLQRSYTEFAAALATLLALDAIWFFFVHFFTSRQAASLGSRLEGRALLWMLNNGVFALIEGILAAWHLTPNNAQALGLTIALAAAINALLDMTLLFHFYFPHQPAGRHVFLAAPFTGRTSDVELRSHIESTRIALEQAGYEVFSSHEREAWGADLWGPAEALTADLKELDATDLLVALFDRTASGGVELEIGAALKLGIPIVQVCSSGDEEAMPYLNRGIARSSYWGSTVTFTDPSECPTIIVKEVERLLNTI